jgi:hypothetical protein
MGPSGHQQHPFPSLSSHSADNQPRLAWEEPDVWKPAPDRPGTTAAVAARHDEAAYRPAPAWELMDRHDSSLWDGTGHAAAVVVAGGRCDAWTQVPVSELDQDGGTSEALSDVARAYKVEVWFGIHYQKGR